MKSLLDKYFISDIANVIDEYVYSEVKEFDNELLEYCLLSGDYLYKTKDYTLVHYLFQNKRYGYVSVMLNNSKYIHITHFQNKNKNEDTELHLLCNVYDNINGDIYYSNILQRIMDSYKGKNIIKYFLNMNNNNETEITNLCSFPLIKILNQLINWDPKYILDKFKNGNNKLYELCEYGEFDIIKKFIESENGLKADHFVEEMKCGDTPLHWLTYNELINILEIIPDLSLKHIIVKTHTNCNPLYNFIARTGNPAILFLISHKQNIPLKPMHFMERNDGDMLLAELLEYNLNIIEQLICDWKPKDFLIRDGNNKYILNEICKCYNYLDIFEAVSGWKIRHFLTEDKGGYTDLYYLCANEYIDTLNFISNLEMKYFTYKYKNGKSILDILLILEQHDIIKQIVKYNS